MHKKLKIGECDALLVVDVQNDFCCGGALAVPGGEEVVPIINRIASCFETVILTQDWHPKNHSCFASSHPGKRPFETMNLAYGEQILWPDHCVQGTPGADLHAALDIPGAQLLLRKGYHQEIDSYSVFFENDRRTPTGLAGYLRERRFRRVWLAGLALDFCVRYSAEDATRCGFKTVLIEDACRALNTEGSLAATRQSLTALDVPSVCSKEVYNG